MSDTNELRRLLADATPTPWTVETDDYWNAWSVTGPALERVPGWPLAEPKAFDDGSACGEYSPRCTEATRDLIVAAVNALPAMLDELDALRADLREAMDLLRAHGQAPSWLLSAGKFGAVKDGKFGSVKDWNRRYGELLAKHKDTP